MTSVHASREKGSQLVRKATSRGRACQVGFYEVDLARPGDRFVMQVHI